MWEKKKRKKKKVKTRKFGHFFFFSNCQNIIMDRPLKCRAGGNTRFHAEPTYWWLRKKLRQRTLQKRCWNANQTGWPEMHLCTQNARGTVVATEATTFLSWNVVGIGRLLHLLFCVPCLFSRSLSLSHTLCGRAVRERFARS
jgi:hypothetical protein